MLPGVTSSIQTASSFGQDKTADVIAVTLCWRVMHFHGRFNFTLSYLIFFFSLAYIEKTALQGMREDRLARQSSFFPAAVPREEEVN